MSESESASSKGLDYLSATATARAYQTKLLEIGQANMQLAFEYAEALVAVRSPADLVSVTAEFTEKGLAMLNKHTKDLAESLSSQPLGATKPK